MTPQELAALPQGTRVRYLTQDAALQAFREYDYGTVELAGSVAHVTWTDGPTTLIDTKSKVWEGFIHEMETA